MKKCPDCGSEKIVKDAKVIDRVHYGGQLEMEVGIDSFPDALVFKEQRRSPVNADVCGECGLMAFYALDPQALWETYQNVRKEVS